MPETQTQLIERAFQELINTKHLYQSVDVDFEPAIKQQAIEILTRRNRDSIGSGIQLNPKKSTIEEVRRELFAELDALEWWCGNNGPQGRVCFSVLPVRTLCSVCDDLMPFNLWAYNDQSGQTTLGSKGKQVWSFPLQCQGCRSEVIVFMVRRIGRRIQLVGRSQFEDVKVPSHIPKEHKGFYSQALIAFNCGQTLAALFLLRTLIEQHMRTVTGLTESRGDDLCDEYNKKLDEDFKGRFPSFKDVYGKLSEALHRADPNKSLFESERERIVNHFDALNVFAEAKKLSPTNDQPKAK